VCEMPHQPHLDLMGLGMFAHLLAVRQGSVQLHLIDASQVVVEQVALAWAGADFEIGMLYTVAPSQAYGRTSHVAVAHVLDGTVIFGGRSMLDQRNRSLDHHRRRLSVVLRSWIDLRMAIISPKSRYADDGESNEVMTGDIPIAR